MAIMALLEGRVKADAVDRLKAALAGLFPETRQYEGCHDITAYFDGDDGRTMVFVEHWESKALHQRYLQWRTETGVIPGLVEMLEAPPTIRYFEQAAA